MGGVQILAKLRGKRIKAENISTDPSADIYYIFI